MAEISLKLGVKILLIVSLVNERVETNTITSILVQNHESDLILSNFEQACWNHNMMIGEKLLRGESRLGTLSIDFEVSNLDTSKVEMDVLSELSLC